MIEIRALKNNDLDALVAKYVLGCKPIWSTSYQHWCCGCAGYVNHMIDQQCSIIADYTSGRFPSWTEDILDAVPVLRRFPLSTSPRTLCEKALKALGFTHAKVPGA